MIENTQTYKKLTANRPICEINQEARELWKKYDVLSDEAGAYVSELEKVNREELSYNECRKQLLKIREACKVWDLYWDLYNLCFKFHMCERRSRKMVNELEKLLGEALDMGLFVY